MASFLWIPFKRQSARFFVSALALVFVASSLGLSEAQAKRFGGGGSIGKPAAPMQRQATPPSNSNQPPAQQQTPAGQQAAQPATAAPAAAASGASRWAAPLMGLAAGLGLAALASYLGIGEELMSIFMIVLLVGLVFFILRMVLSRGRSSSASGPMSPALARSGLSTPSSSGWAPSAASDPGSAYGAPKDRITTPEMTQAQIDQFLQVARAQFLSLQKLWDAGDLKAIEGFCTSAMAQEMAGQLALRGHAVNYTSVVNLEVEWLGMHDAVNDQGIAVDEAHVGFNGLVRESEDEPAESFHEIWVLQKRKDGQDGWLLAGISQHT